MDASDLAARVARLRREAAELAATEVGAVDAAQATVLHGELRAATDQLRALAARLLCVVDDDGRAAGGDTRTLAQSVARREGTSVGAAHRELALGRALEEALPGTRAAVADGSITLEHAQVLSRLGPTSDARRAALASDRPDRNERFLLDAARSTPVDGFRKDVQRWANRVDRETTEREHAVATAKEHLVLSPRDDGVAIQGFLTAENGALLTTALRAVTGVPAADDDRSAEQRAAASLTGLARLVLDRGLAGAGAQVRPHLSVHVAWETMQALERPESVTDLAALTPAELETGEPLPTSTLSRLLCDSELTRIVFDPEGQVLDVGRAQRTYGGQLRRAVVARDRTCAYPGCDACPALGEVHHVMPWSQGGPTSVENGVLLCWYHHDLVHRRRLQIQRAAHGWAFATPDGTPISAPRGGPGARSQGPPPDRGPGVPRDSEPGAPPEHGPGAQHGDRDSDPPALAAPAPASGSAPPPNFDAPPAVASSTPPDLAAPPRAGRSRSSPRAGRGSRPISGSRASA
jgi:hypothetical protein